MKTIRKTICLVLILTVGCIAAAAAENEAGDTEQGVEEILPLLEVTELKDTEGMSLEEMSDALAENAMSEYIDAATGFSMQYPSVFMFDEESAVPTAVTADGKAVLKIECMENQGELDEEVLRGAIVFETPDAEIVENEKNGCLRVDRTADQGKTCRTDLYLITQNSFHHISVSYPAEEKEIYCSYIEYMINTIETNETDLG